MATGAAELMLGRSGEIQGLKMKFGAGLALLLAVSLSGCAGSFEAPPATANYGVAPTNYQDAVKEKMKFSLFDPFTAQYDFGVPYKAYGNQGLLYGGKVAFVGWAVDVRINAKNRMGGYVGWTPYLALFRSNGELVDVIDNSFNNPLVHRVQ